MENQRMELRYDVVQFINLVRQHPVLYQVSHPCYKSSFSKNNAWKKIHLKTGIDILRLKAKWRSLRDSYKKHKQISKKRYSNWRWANDMAFIDIEPACTDDSTIIEINSQMDDNKDLNQNEQSHSEQCATANDIKIEDEGTEIEVLEGEEIEAEEIISGEEMDGEEDPLDPEEEIEEFKIIHVVAEDDTSHNKNLRCKKRTGTEYDCTHSGAININSNNCNKKAATSFISTNTADSLVQVTCDRIDMEFLGYANSIKMLPLHRQAIVKLQITRVITAAQLKEFDQKKARNWRSRSSSCINCADQLESKNKKKTLIDI